MRILDHDKDLIKKLDTILKDFSRYYWDHSLSIVNVETKENDNNNDCSIIYALWSSVSMWFKNPICLKPVVIKLLLPQKSSIGTMQLMQTFARSNTDSHKPTDNSQRQKTGEK